MGILFKNGNWWIRVNGDEHPPVHCHLVHPDGDALLFLSGKTLNRHVPADALAQAQAWISEHEDAIRSEWNRLNREIRP